MGIQIAMDSGKVVLKNGVPGCRCCGDSECPSCNSFGVVTASETCVYSFNLEEPLGCYSPNQTRNRASQAFTIGPIEGAYSAKIVSAEVDDDLEVDGEIIQSGQHLVDLGAGETCEGSYFPGGRSASNGAHSLSEVSLGNYGSDFGRPFLSLRAVDNHGIQLFARGVLELVPISPAP